MIKKSLPFVVIFTIFLSMFSTNALSNDKPISNVENLTYKQELIIPIDTSLDEAKFQPIDMRLEFTNPCWAKNESIHSVRVCYDDGYSFTEIESQIYALEQCDDTHIKSCSLIFLIPEEANGKEKYYVLYDDSETPPPEYTDHLQVVDSHYYFEPISGQKADFSYFKITEDDYIVYAISYEGQLLGNGISQVIAKLKPNSKEVEAVDIDQFAAFVMLYSTDKGARYTGTSWATDTSKTILIDGNLMVRLKIVGVSPEGTIKTDNIYTYYYCPSDVKRVSVNVNHEVLETYEIRGNQLLDGTYAALMTFKGRSASIGNINIGTILPYLHLYSEDDKINEYPVPTDPDSKIPEAVLSITDDVDMGGNAWYCVDNPSTGKTHGLIFESNTGIQEGKDDGLQVISYVEQTIKLPGLEADTGVVYATRNYYEKEGDKSTVVPKGLNVTFDVEFVTFEEEGYNAVAKESVIYQKLAAARPSSRQNGFDADGDDNDRYSLTTYVHFAPNFPLGNLLSAATGKNFSYLYAELYKGDDVSLSSGVVGRLPIYENVLVDFTDARLLEKIEIALGLFDWGNGSVFKRIVYPGLKPGIYVVKIFRENPLFVQERQYIGFAIIELASDDSVHVYCRCQGSIELSVFDQEGGGVENVRFLLEHDGVTIAEAVSDENGGAILNAPCFPTKPYNLRVVYNGFLVEEKIVTLGLKHHFFELKESFSLEHYNLRLRLKDTWGFAPAVEVNPVLSSSKMVDPVLISGEKTVDGEYVFTGLFPSKYTLTMGYKSFDVTEDVLIERDKTLDIVFPAEYEIDFDVLNSYGNRVSDAEIKISRGMKSVSKVIDEDGKAMFYVPPGEYKVMVFSDDEEIAKQIVQVRGNKKTDVVTLQGSFLNSMGTYLGVILALFSIIFILWKRNIFVGLKLLVIALIVIALVSPWWVLNGENGVTSTTTHTFLAPSNIVTLTSSSDVFGGDVGQVPAEVPMVLGLLSMLLVVSGLLIFLGVFTKNRLRKTTFVLSVLSVVLLIVILSVFFYTLLQLTEVGVGSVMGNGDLEITIPGVAEREVLSCTWGLGMGFYLTIIAVVILIVVTFCKKSIFKKRSFI